MIEVRQARYFLAVAETLHFGRAAEQLAMSQPPLSQAILQLERQLGVTLLDRSGRKVTLTETGRAFAAECRAFIAAARHAQQVATQAEAGLAGTLRIGVVTSALSEPLLSTLAAIRDARPRVDLQITEVDTASGEQALFRHEIDIAAIRPATPVRGLRIQPWRHDELVIAFPPGHPLADGAPSPVRLARFADEPWVWLRREASPDYHDQMMATCRQAGFSPGIRHLANSIFTQLAMTASGLGVTLVPDVTVRQIQPATPYRPLTDRTGIVELSLVTRDGAHEPLTDHFLRIALPLQAPTARQPAAANLPTTHDPRDNLSGGTLATAVRGRYGGCVPLPPSREGWVPQPPPPGGHNRRAETSRWRPCRRPATAEHRCSNGRRTSVSIC